MPDLVTNWVEFQKFNLLSQTDSLCHNGKKFIMCISLITKLINQTMKIVYVCFVSSVYNACVKVEIVFWYIV